MSVSDPGSPLSSDISRHCAFHTVASALPSFFIALFTGWSFPSQVLGMLLGIYIFYLLAVFLHRSKPLLLIMKGEASSRAFLWSKRIRLLQVLLIIPGVFLSKGFLLMPDLYAGLLANLATNKFGLADVNAFNRTSSVTGYELFAQALAATFIEGWILAAAISLLSLILWIGLRIYQLIVKPDINKFQKEA